MGKKKRQDRVIKKKQYIINNRIYESMYRYIDKKITMNVDMRVTCRVSLNAIIHLSI